VWLFPARRSTLTSFTSNQQTSGSALMGQATYFFQQAGLSNSAATTMNLCLFAVGFVGTVGSWFIMKPFGRRPLFLYGQAACTFIMMITGIVGSTTKRGGAAGWGIGGLLIFFTFIYDLTIGPIAYSLVGEMPSTRLRAKTIILSRNLYNLGGLIIGILNPYMLNPVSHTSYSTRMKTADIKLQPDGMEPWSEECLRLVCDWSYLRKWRLPRIWAQTDRYIAQVVWIWFRLPEPKGRTYGELDVLFQQKVPARKFASTEVSEFDAHEKDAVAAILGAGVVH
jgi:SP family general alpha glucoside:H+ symporter-like MFS transporter